MLKVDIRLCLAHFGGGFDVPQEDGALGSVCGVGLQSDWRITAMHKKRSCFREMDGGGGGHIEFASPRQDGRSVRIAKGGSHVGAFFGEAIERDVQAWVRRFAGVFGSKIREFPRDEERGRVGVERLALEGLTGIQRRSIDLQGVGGERVEEYPDVAHLPGVLMERECILRVQRTPVDHLGGREDDVRVIQRDSGEIDEEGIAGEAQHPVVGVRENLVEVHDPKRVHRVQSDPIDNIDFVTEKREGFGRQQRVGRCMVAHGFIPGKIKKMKRS